MKNQERACDFLMVILFLLLVFGCAPAQNDTKSSAAPTPTPHPVISDAVVKDPGGNTLAYFLGFSSAINEQTDAFFMLSGGEIVNINMVTGAFENEAVMFASNNCTGQGYVQFQLPVHEAMVPNRVIQGGGKAYKFGGLYGGATFTPLTMWTGVICYTITPGDNIPDVHSGDYLFTKQGSTLTDLSVAAPLTLQTE